MADEQGMGMDPYGALLEMGNRIRILESKYNSLRERILIINQNMIDEYKKLIQEVKLVNEEIKDVKKDVFEIKEAVKHLARGTEVFAKKEDLKVLEKYINLWNPLKFVTEKEVEEIIKRSKQNAKRTK